jgi:hypothetical protein
MAYTLPTERGIEDLIVTAIVELLTCKLTTEVDTGDVSRAVVTKTGPLQATPNGVTVLVHENDPNDAQKWPHRPVRISSMRTTGSLVGNTYEDETSLRTSLDQTFIGGGSCYSRAFTLEFEAFGLYFPSTGATIEREDVSRVAATVVNRAILALRDAWCNIGTGDQITDDFGESVWDGPYIGETWTDPEAGESLLVRKFVQIWYKTANSWSIG